MAEGIENTQEQKVILKKAKPDLALTPQAQPQVQQTAEQKPVRTIKRKLKPVAHPTQNSAHSNITGQRPAGEQKRRPVVSSTPVDPSAQVKKAVEHSAQPSERKNSGHMQTEENRRVQKHGGERTERYDRLRSEKPMRKDSSEAQVQTQSDNKNQIRSLDLSSNDPTVVQEISRGGLSRLTVSEIKVIGIEPTLQEAKDAHGNRMGAVIRITAAAAWAAIRRIDRVRAALINPVSKADRIEAVPAVGRCQARCRLKPTNRILKKRLRAKKPIHARIRKANSLKRSYCSKRRKLKKR